MKISRRKVCSIFIFSQVFYIKIVESKRERERERECVRGREMAIYEEIEEMNGEESEKTRNTYHPKNYIMKGEHIL